VFTPYSFIFICIRHMIGKIGEKWQRAMTWLSMAEKAIHWSKNVQSIASTMTLKLLFAQSSSLTLTVDIDN
jgi:hypothetical protein